jgi:hypothetical protein
MVLAAVFMALPAVLPASFTVLAAVFIALPAVLPASFTVLAAVFIALPSVVELAFVTTALLPPALVFVVGVVSQAIPMAAKANKELRTKVFFILFSVSCLF